MDSRNSSILWRLAALVLLVALLTAPAAVAVRAQDTGPSGSNVVLMPETLDGNRPELTDASNSWNSGGSAIVPGSAWTITFNSTPFHSVNTEEVDSWQLNGPTDGTTPGSWTVASIGAAPANNRGNGLSVGQAFQQPQTGGNTSYRAHAYWGYVTTGGNAFSYVNAATITPPIRSWWLNPFWGVYEATATGGPMLSFVATFNIPSSWTSYLCPGALAPNDQWIGLSGVNANPNWMQGILYSSSCSGAPCPRDARLTPIRACRQPAVSVTKTGTVTGSTGNPGGPGTVTVQYCFTVTNATTPGSGVHLASYQVTDSAIGYNSGTVSQALAPGASASQICAPDYTFNVTWPATGNVCVTNSSGASATGTTPPGWGEITPGVLTDGFTTRTFTSPTATGGVGLQTCTSPLAVTLAGFEAVQQGDAVQVSWETVSELDNLGFNLYRGVSPDGWERQLNDALIPSAAPGSSGGYAYTWEDRAGLVPGTTYYLWLEDVDLNGATTLHGPVSVDFVAPTAVRVTALHAQGGAPWLPWTVVVLAVLAALAAMAVAGQRRRVSRR